jgi:hypothetical protein
MNGYVEMEDLDAVSEMVEDLESDESDESDEDIDMMERTQRSRRFRTPPRTAQGGGLFRPRTPAAGGPAQYVTQTQLQSAMARVGAQIKTNSDALKTVNSRVATLSTDITKQTAEIKKLSTKETRDTSGLRRDLNSTRQMAAIMPLLSTPKSQALTEAAGGLPAGTKVVIDTGDNLSLLLPLLMMGGMGGGSGGEGGSGGGMGDMMLPMVLLMSQR